jgi:hypothetical protein
VQVVREADGKCYHATIITPFRFTCQVLREMASFRLSNLPARVWNVQCDLRPFPRLQATTPLFMVQ